MILKANKSGNSLSITIPEEMAIELNIADGDNLYVTKTPNGYEITAFDPEFAKRMEIARSGMKKYRNALIELAK